MNERSIFSSALDIADPAERAAYLERACHGDADLRHHIEALLAAECGLGSFLNRPALLPVATTPHDPPAEGPGSRVGPYKLLQEIGEGGMGTVFMAEQEQPIRRMVALKIIRAGMDSKGVLARFEAERQALALMDHPNIAKVLDAGTTASGRPYFVMELVKGIPITRFCDEHQLSLRERLELFVGVCSAIQHAHQKGIIHRDIKPSNVLVALYDDRPVPKVIDFGVAKATSQRLTERTLFTGFGTVVGTLEYMSPEQAKLNQLDIDTRSDVYALGVLLYELLTGTTPLDRVRLASAALDEVLRLIREEEPPPPSTRLSTCQTLPRVAANRRAEPAQLGKVLSGELDWIVMKALEKDRTRRYETANGLARDVERYLKDEPVEACPPAAGYRLRRFVRQNRAALGTAAALAGLLLTGTAVSAWQALAARRAEAVAWAERDEKEKARQAEAAERAAAERRRQEALAARDATRRALYASDLNLVQAAWQAGNVARVLDLLHRQVPRSPDQPDLRGFEWHYWDRLCHADLRTVQLPGTNHHVSGAAFTRDGTRFVTAHIGPGAVIRVRLWDTATGSEVRSWTMPVNGNPTLVRLAFGVSGDGSRVFCRAIPPSSRPGQREPAPEGAEPEIRVWDARTGKQVAALPPDEAMRQAMLSHDGKHLIRLAVTRGKTEVRNLDTGEVSELPRFGPFTGGHSSVAVSPAGTYLVISTAERSAPSGGRAPGSPRIPLVPSETRLVLVNYRTGEVIQQIAPANPRARQTGVQFGPDGTWLLADEGADLVFRRIPSGEVMRVVPSPFANASPRGIVMYRASLGLLAVSPDGKRIAHAAGGDVLVGDAKTGRLTHTLRGHPDTIRGVAFAADGKRVYSVGAHGTLKTWSVEEPAPDEGTRIPAPDGQRFAVRRREVRDVLLVDAAGKELTRYAGHTAPVLALAWSPDGESFVTADSAGLVRVWNPRTGGERFALPLGKLPLRSIRPPGLVLPPGFSPPPSIPGAPEFAFSRDGKRLAIDHPGGVKVVELASGKERFAKAGKVRLAALAPDGRTVATRIQEGESPVTRTPQVTVWDVATGQERFRIGGVAAQDGSVVFSPDDKRLAVLTGPEVAYAGGRVSVKAQRVEVWDVSTRAMVFPAFARPCDWVDWAAFSPDGSRVAVTSFRNPQIAEVTVWNLTNGVEEYTITESAQAIRHVAWSPDGARLTAFVTRTSDQNEWAVKVWDAAGGRELLSLPVSERRWPNSRPVFSSDGRRLLLMGGGNLPFAIHVWDAAPRPNP